MTWLVLLEGPAIDRRMKVTKRVQEIYLIQLMEVFLILTEVSQDMAALIETLPAADSWKISSR